MEKKKMPIGIEDFAEIITQGFYYVDKTGMIKELLSNWGKVNLFTRPRRFGKSINMSMLKYFFEIGTDKNLFDGLAISKETELCEKYMGHYPVVSISLKGIEGANYSVARSMAVDVINEEARRLSFLLDSDNLIPNEKELLTRLMDKNMEDGTLVSGLRNLTELLEIRAAAIPLPKLKNVKAKLHRTFEGKIKSATVSKTPGGKYYAYDEMIKLIRGMFHQALKTNSNLEFAVLTGCIRVSKESIFTGLNNLKMYTSGRPDRDCFHGGIFCPVMILRLSMAQR